MQASAKHETKKADHFACSTYQEPLGKYARTYVQLVESDNQVVHFTGGGKLM